MINNNIQIAIIHDGEDGYSVQNNVIYWDPSSGLVVDNSSGTPVGVQSSAIGLIHEGGHATDPNIATDVNVSDAQYGNLAERYAVGVEDSVAAQLVVRI